MKNLFVNITYLLVLFSIQKAFAQQPGHLPSEWLISNEKALEQAEKNRSWNHSNTVTSHHVETQRHQDISGLRSSMSQIMKGSRKSLSKVDNIRGKKWTLTTIRWDLAVTASGLVGILGLGGSAFSSLRWEPRTKNNEPQPDELQNDQPSEEIPIISFSSEMNEKEILKELRPAINAAYESKSISDKDALSQTLLTKTQELQDLVRGLEGTRPQNRIWWVDKIRLRIDVKASGMIAPKSYMGAMVRFRFQWQRIKPKNKNIRNFDVPSYRESSMKNFITEMSKDLETYESINLQNKKFYLKYIRLRVGLGAKGSVHLAKLDGSVAGAIFFTSEPKKAYNHGSFADRTPRHSHSVLSTETHDTTEENYLDLQDELTPTTQRLAKITNTVISSQFNPPHERHIITESMNTTPQSPDSALFKVSRKKFKRGLRKSARIAKNMITMLGDADTKKWILNKAYIGFEVILTGGVGPVTLKGKSSIELRFNRRS